MWVFGEYRLESVSYSLEWTSRGVLRGIAALLISAALVAGCGGNPNRPTATDASRLYKKAYKSLQSKNYSTAIDNYELLSSRYPFSDEAKQAQLDLMYAYYKNDEPDSAVDIADTFLREQPTHPRVDYAWYIKGLVYFPRERGPIEKLLRVDLSERPPSNAHQSFENFERLVNVFPASPYAEDARQRMVFLRNRLAEFEMHVAKYYIRRGAWVAAINRAKWVLENYQETPLSLDALEILVDAYGELQMVDLAQDAERILAVNRDRVDEKLRLQAEAKPPAASTP